MRFILNIFSLSFLALIGFAACVAGFLFLYLAKGPLQEDQEILINRGMGTAEIAQMLEDQGAIYNRYPFMIASRFQNNAKPLQAGEFLIPVQASTAAILDLIQNGQTIQRKFTIPEGKTSWEIVQILNANDMLAGEITDIPPEGSLMPETYFFTKGDTRLSKIARLQEAMTDFLAQQDQSKLEALPLETMEEAVILASIVEKETSVPGEYEKVAGVFINRLRLGMPLQTDPTVIYGMTKGQHESNGQGPLGRRLLTRDLEADTPYNTYTRPGLPPTPICNPGRAAIEAVLNPASHDYLYFVADGSGGHAFGKTLAEHNRNVAQWRKIRRGQ